MKKFRKKGFTLIELIAVLVIMAIIALIVTPLVMSIIKKAHVSADKRSVDAYGRSIELAIAGYLMDNGSFPTSIEQLTIEYSGEEVVCTTTQLNSDSSIYLAGCTVGGRSVDGYTYGSDKSPSYEAYSVGDEVTYNNVDYYVIKDSGAKESNVTLLKAEPLSIEEVNVYGGVGTTNNHVNMNTTSDTSASYYQAAYDNNGYGGIQYYSGWDCYSGGNTDNCTSNYDDSEIKYVVDAWKTAQAPQATRARLITVDEIPTEKYKISCGGCGAEGDKASLNFMYNEYYNYWTMSPAVNDDVFYVSSEGHIDPMSVCANMNNSELFGVVRPVIVLNKSVL